jgi:DNA-binding response OmpR family regulator
MARLLIVEPEAYVRALLDDALAQAGFVAVEAANRYEGLPAGEAACLADGLRDLWGPARARLLLVEAEAQFLTFFQAVLEQEGYVVTTTVPSAVGLPAVDTACLADVMLDIQYLVIY